MERKLSINSCYNFSLEVKSVNVFLRRNHETFIWNNLTALVIMTKLPNSSVSLSKSLVNFKKCDLYKNRET